MASGAWEPYASVLAMLANMLRDPAKRPRPWTPDDWNPLKDTRPDQATATVVGDMGELKEAFQQFAGRRRG